MMDLSERVVQTQIEDYALARSEVVAAIGNQHTTLSFGTGALVAAFGVGFVSWGKSIAPAVFIGIVPLSWWILTMWLGEVVRMLRAVEFCGHQERIVNASIRAIDSAQPDSLRWEQWRQDPDVPWRTIVWTYKSVGFLLLCTNLGAMGCWTVTAIQSHWKSCVIALIWLMVFAGGIPFLLWIRKTYKTWTADVGMPSAAREAVPKVVRGN